MDRVTLDDYKDRIESVVPYSFEYMKSKSIIKLDETNETVTIGHVNRIKHNFKRDLERLHRGKELEFLLISLSELNAWLSRNSSGNTTIKQSDYNEHDLNRLANDAPVINLVNGIIIDGINRGASDIHIEKYRDEVTLRFRIDGVLITDNHISNDIFPYLSSRIKIMANLNIMERRLPQDGRITVTLENYPIDLRISIVPLSDGESIVLRLFIKKEERVVLEDLGFNNEKIKQLYRAINFPFGLILVTGPTGSGKTTTLNSLLQHLNDSHRKIITIEDPVEYKISGVNQIEVNNDIGLTFSSILRRVLRQDPDIIMIGEIRDRETAELVVQAAMTGHLVLSTLHTNDAISSINRLRDLGIDNYLIPAVLKASFAQRLLRKICLNCHGEGCRECQNTGYKGRTVISEGFVLDEKLEEMILDNNKPAEIKMYLKHSGMVDLLEDAKNKVIDGISDINEVNRVC